MDNVESRARISTQKIPNSKLHRETHIDRLWDPRGVVHQKYLSKGRNSTVNVERYSKTLFNLRTSIKNKHSSSLSHGVVFLHDNARPHVAALTQSFLKDFCWDILSHPPYSLDLAPSDFELITKLKPALRGIRFHSDAEVEQWCCQYFHKLDASYYDAGIHKLLPCYKKCLHNLGDYVEK